MALDPGPCKSLTNCHHPSDTTVIGQRAQRRTHPSARRQTPRTRPTPREKRPMPLRTYATPTIIDATLDPFELRDTWRRSPSRLTNRHVPRYEDGTRNHEGPRPLFFCATSANPAASPPSHARGTAHPGAGRRRAASGKLPQIEWFRPFPRSSRKTHGPLTCGFSCGRSPAARRTAGKPFNSR